MRFFNKDSDITYSEFNKNIIVYPDLHTCQWIDYKDLPESEQNTDTKNMDGMLKTLDYKDAWKEYWARATEEQKKFFMTLPNFTPEIFFEITGIKVNEELSLSGKEVTVTLDGKSYTAIIK
jgi:leucyl aminopeptidase (aminopeptidase T)